MPLGALLDHGCGELYLHGVVPLLVPRSPTLPRDLAALRTSCRSARTLLDGGCNFRRLLESNSGYTAAYASAFSATASSSNSPA